MTKQKNMIFLFSIIMTGVVWYVFYPGMMSYDTLHAYRGALYGVKESMWPPMVSYVWALINLFNDHPSTMFFFQIFLFFFSSFLILNCFNLKKMSYFSFSALVLLIPSLLGTLVVIWKDVLMSSLLLILFLIIVNFSKKNNFLKLRFFIILIFAIIAVSIRHNAIVAIVPFIFYYFVKLNSSSINYKKVISFSLLMIAVIYGGKKTLDHYRLPDFKKIKSANSQFLLSVRALDLAGSSICQNKNILSSEYPSLTLDFIKKNYDPKHINHSTKYLNALKPFDDRITTIWLRQIISSPFCLFKNKFDMFSTMLGGGKGKQFLITHPAIDQNEFSFSLKKSKVRDSFFRHITGNSKLPLLKPWFYNLITLIFFSLLGLYKKLSLELFVLYSSSVFYMLGLFMFGNASDARLLFYSNNVSLLVLLISLSSRFELVNLLRKKKSKIRTRV